MELLIVILLTLIFLTLLLYTINSILYRGVVQAKLNLIIEYLLKKN